MVALRFLSQSDMERIHQESIGILEKLGVKIHHKEALQILAQAGARVDFDQSLAKLPKALVEESIKRVPRSFRLASRNPQLDVVIEEGKGPYGRPVTGAEGYLDLESDVWRRARLQDVREWISIANQLENIHFLALPYPEDVPLRSRDIRIAIEAFDRSEKHFMLQPYGRVNAEAIAEMAAVVAGGRENLRARPLVSFVSCLVSPLRYNPEDVDVLLVAGKYGLPVHLGVLPSAGGTAPVTIPGIVLSSNAEILAGITLAQVANPGTPLVYLAVKFSLDMSGGLALQGNVESAMAAAAGMQLAKEFYGIPCSTFGPATDSLVPDGQSLMERSFTSLMPALAGADILGGAGQLEQCLTVSPVQLVIDNELLGLCLRASQGVTVDEEMLALEAIARVAHQGSFLSDPHTLRHFRSHYYWPKLISRRTRAAWEREGSKDFLARARERARELAGKGLAVEGVLSASVKERLVEVLSDAEKRLGGEPS